MGGVGSCRRKLKQEKEEKQENKMEREIYNDNERGFNFSFLGFSLVNENSLYKIK